MNILIVKLSALGDVTHTLPALIALRRAFPEARIDWLIEETAAPIIRGHAALDHALVWSRRRFSEALQSGRLGEAWRILQRFVRELRSTPYDLVLDFQALMKSGVWVLLSRGRRKVGFGRGMDRSEGSYIFLTERVPAVSMEIHALDRGLMLLEAVGVSRGPVEYGFPIPSETRRDVDRLLSAAGIAPEQRIIALHPMTRWTTKLWSEQGFARVADGLIDHGFRVVFTGAAGDAPVLDAVERRMQRRAVRLDGKVDLKGLAAVFERAAAVVSTDTGPMHIAAAVGTRVVALFGPTAPNRTGPYGPGHVVLQAGLPCSPCFSRQCRRPAAEPLACMTRQRPEAVIEAVLKIVDRQGAGGGSLGQGREVGKAET